MIDKKAVTAPKGITLADIYYVLFRWKYLILTMTLLGIGAAALEFVYYPFNYTSEAKLLIRYVVDTSSTDGLTGEMQIRPTSQAATILNSELEILGSRDLALMAADIVGPRKILGGNSAAATNRFAAAAKINKDMRAGVVLNSDVIYLEFTSQNRDVPQAVLEQLLLAYTNRHREIHLKPGVSEESIQQLAENTQLQLKDNEKDLHEQLTKLGVLSVDEARSTFQIEVSRLREQISMTAADLVEHEATAAELKKRLPEGTPEATNDVTVTNIEPLATSVVEAYTDANQNLMRLQARLDDDLTRLTTNSLLIQSEMANLAQAKETKRRMETEHPRLVAMAPQQSGRNGGPTGASPQDILNDEVIKVKAITAKLNLLTNTLSEVESNVALINNAGTQIQDLQRTRDMNEATYRRLAESLNQARIAAALGPGHVSNISVVELPTPPLREGKARLPKTYGFLVSGLILGLVLSFAIELYLSQTIKRPSEIQTELDLPCFISIPRLNGKARQHHGARSAGLLNNGDGEPKEIGGGELAVRKALPAMTGGVEMEVYHESLRDKLVAFCEMINLTHKPKLVAVTSCNEGAGVTTVAAGLAASLSETGDGNVLLVNMNVENGEAHHFYRGKLACDLDEVLQKEKPADSRVQENLYVAKEGDQNRSLPRVLPKRFNNLVAKMKGSDFDYIIFDMPPVSQISITGRLARFMDIVLMVVESQKTDRDAAKRAAAMLQETKTHVGVVLNKHRSYVPKSLCQEI